MIQTSAMQQIWFWRISTTQTVNCMRANYYKTQKPFLCVHKRVINKVIDNHGDVSYSFVFLLFL